MIIPDRTVAFLPSFMKTPLLVNLCQKLLFLHQLTHNLLSYCELVDAGISASEKYLPVPETMIV